MARTNIIFLGMPGSGKGTISSILEKKTNIIQISTGDIFREEINNKTELGLKVQSIVESGSYVPDDITNKIVENKILQMQANNQKFILDGFPRTIQQAMFLDQLNFEDYIVIYLDINKQIVIDRLSQRYFCKICKKSYNLTSFRSKKHPYCENDCGLLIQRADDQPEAVKKRLDIYEKETIPVVEFYQRKNKLFTINQHDDINEIIDKILDIIL